MTDAEYLNWFNREFWHTLHGPGVGSPLSVHSRQRSTNGYSRHVTVSISSSTAPLVADAGLTANEGEEA